MPGWLLAALVVGCLATAAWMFWADSRLEESTKDGSSAKDDRELAEGVLDVPKDEDAEDNARREDAGRDRLDAGDEGVSTTSDDDRDEDAEPEPLPPVFEHLNGRTIAIAAASVGSNDDAERTVRVGGLRIPCAGAADADRIEAELALAARVREVLERAGATVLDTSQSNGKLTCADARVRANEGADLAIVIRSGADTARVLAARPTDGTGRESRGASAAFAAELAGALGLDGPSAATSSRTRELLADTGAIDLDGGAAIAYVEPVADSDAAADELALALARAMALTLVRAERD